jgi:type II secretory pathway predicted ATPase ExeA
MNKQLLALYGIKWNPFSADVPTEALWVTPEIEHFCWRLEQQLREGGFALITGEPGSGKSVALRLAAHRLSQLPDVMVGVVDRPQSHLGDFYREVGELFGVLLSPHNRWGGFKALRSKWQEHLATTLYRPLLLIDEAQAMQPAVFSELRSLSSTNFDSRSILTVVLCGDQRILEQFQSQELLPIASRMRVRLNLDEKTHKELSSYLEHVLAEAGNPGLMTPELIQTLCQHAVGNYRCLSTTANELLAEAARREAPQIDEKLFLETFAPSTKTTQPRRVRNSNARRRARP